MRVVLDAGAVRYPLTGVGRYAYELGRHLLDSSSIDTLRFLNGGALNSSLPNARPGSGKGLFGRCCLSLVRKSDVALDCLRHLKDLRGSLTLRNASADVFHGTSYYLPRFAGTSIATFHDLSVFSEPRWHPPERIRVLQRAMEVAVGRADLLIADSEFVRAEICTYFSLPADRTCAVPLGVSGEFKPRAPADIAPRLAALGLQPQAYCLFSGTIEPRKNLDTLLSAYERLPIGLRERYPLVVCGYTGWLSCGTHARLDRCARAGWLRYLGYVSAEKLPTLYAGARVFALPSFHEGFGLPVIEAMASGAPVICSNAGALPEVAGDAALLHNPADTEHLTDLLRRALEDREWRDRARSDGLRRARQFSWRRCAEQTVKAYRDAVASREGLVRSSSDGSVDSFTST